MLASAAQVSPRGCHQAAAPTAARCSLGREQGPAGKSLKQSAVSCGQTGALSSKLPQVSVSREETSSTTGSSPSPDLPPEGCGAAAVPTLVWGRSAVGWAPLVRLKPASLAIGVGRPWLGSCACGVPRGMSSCSLHAWAARGCRSLEMSFRKHAYLEGIFAYCGSFSLRSAPFRATGPARG